MGIPKILAAGVAAWMCSAAGGAWAEEYPYCAVTTGGYGSAFENCGFISMAQCRETVWGMGGYCRTNPAYVSVAPGRRLHRSGPAVQARPRP